MDHIVILIIIIFAFTNDLKHALNRVIKNLLKSVAVSFTF